MTDFRKNIIVWV